MEQQVNILGIIDEMRSVQYQSRIFMERLTEHAKLSSNHFMLLMDLKLNGSMRITEIAERFAVTAGAITSMCDKLEQQQLIYRDRQSEDRRVVKVALTEQGERIISETFSVLPVESLEEILAVFKQVNALMSTIIDKAEL